VSRGSAYQKDLAQQIEQAICFDGFSIIDIWGGCPGRYLRKNKLSPKMIEEMLKDLPPVSGPVPQNARPEYGHRYQEQMETLAPVSMPAGVDACFDAPQPGRQEVILLGSAGQRILTAGEILGIAGLTAGLNVTQKNDYNITVLVGPSVSELILSPEKIDYTGITTPTAVIALAPEGVARRKSLFSQLGPETLVIQASGVEIPPTSGKVVPVDFKSQKVKKTDWALASLAVLAQMQKVLTGKMLDAALTQRFKTPVLSQVRELVSRVST